MRRSRTAWRGAARFHEMMSYSFLSDAMISKLGQKELPYVRVSNPVDQGEARVRRGVLPTLLADLEANRRNQADVRLFEIGKGYEPEHANERGEPGEVPRAGPRGRRPARAWKAATTRAG